ncbi:hypothetical protein F0562_027719 [Nyssa sinensis]|uniref:Uncharacterized protein n=1 Tax=Nyssa sinensis TaxID=561372 RepID=A0A5J5BA98_9ASTE|nr:hypothetical protein F0562_027719 [Nyssa sinensis]
MASTFHFFILLSLLLSSLPNPSFATTRKLAALVQQQPLILKYHNGELLKGNTTVNLIWYGKFSPVQRSIIVDFLRSLNSGSTLQPSVSSWWQTTEKYKSGVCTIVVGNQILDESYSLGKSLKTSDIIALASKALHMNSINVVLTAADVAVDGFCMSSCGMHGPAFGDVKDKRSKFAYAWVGDSVTQCPGQCAWPFHQPIYGPQTPPLVAPNGDIGVDGMVINLATVLAGTVTNPFDDGYYQGPASAPLEAVTACSGIFGSGAYPGYAGAVLVDKTTVVTASNGALVDLDNNRRQTDLSPFLPKQSPSLSPFRQLQCRHSEPPIAAFEVHVSACETAMRTYLGTESPSHPPMRK